MTYCCNDTMNSIRGIYMKKTLITPLLTLLVVSCGTTLPSFESSVSSSSSTSSSSSSTSTSSSTSSTTSETPLNTRKVPFNQIGSLVAQVVDAKAMGIVNSKDRVQPSGRRNAQDEDQNYMVKITETYNPNTEITEDQTVQVTFSRVTNTQTTELQTGTESYLANAEASEIERLTDLPGNIVITNVEGNEYRLLSEEAVVQDWISSELETLEFIFDEALTGITLESRSLNASISFIAFEGFTYTIKQGETIIYEDLEDNDEADNNEALGNMTLSGLTEGLTYDVTYEGYQVIETITQDEVEGQVDKLYVLYQYTFISFVPLNLNQRPDSSEILLDYDGVAFYDKFDYFSNNLRQSFVVDNNTGLIYKIENLDILSLRGGCIRLRNNSIPFDMRINNLGQLEFYALYSNVNIYTGYCLKDIYGNKLVLNDAIDYRDESTKTIFVNISTINQKFIGKDSNIEVGPSYFLTSSGLIANVIELDSGWPIFKVIDSKGELRDLNQTDKFEIYLTKLPFRSDIDFERLELTLIGLGFSFLYFKTTISSGVYSILPSMRPNVLNVLNGKDSSQLYLFPSQWWTFMISYFNEDKISFYEFNLSPYSNQFNGTSEFFVSFKFFDEFDILFFWSYREKKAIYFTNVLKNFTNTVASLQIDNSYSFETNDQSRIHTDVNLSDFLGPEIDIEMLLNAQYSDQTRIFTKVEINGNTDYDIFAVLSEYGYILTPFVSGTYIAPPTTTITLQPINN
jgi:hypothetical protein